MSVGDTRLSSSSLEQEWTLEGLGASPIDSPEHLIKASSSDVNKGNEQRRHRRQVNQVDPGEHGGVVVFPFLSKCTDSTLLLRPCRRRDPECVFLGYFSPTRTSFLPLLFLFFLPSSTSHSRPLSSRGVRAANHTAPLPLGSFLFLTPPFLEHCRPSLSTPALRLLTRPRHSLRSELSSAALHSTPSQRTARPRQGCRTPVATVDIRLCVVWENS